MIRWFLLIFVTCCLLSGRTQADETSASARAILKEFTESWDESSWGGGRRAYIRPLKMDDWHVRMRSLQKLVQLGAQAKQDILATLKDVDGDVPARILAAQALGYLDVEVTADELVGLLKKEPSAAVRLYLVDAIGMLGLGEDASPALTEFRKTERSGDVRRHIGYAKERGGEKIKSEIVTSLQEFDAGKIGSAKVGEAAPDFRLKTVDGEEVQLSDFRGKQPVVLVFIYGDT